ncbi:ABC transporter substrate-binding protein [Mucilaginibacter mali]|uniref:ABC transporter substrate-binding protein n=1 Tax=Mucilaginibacter mali TaxID=2740462 RepID=A0A7D4U9V6_9SPHI|nr:helical backbone metal receptor [Mucilaginibacter mali]QKJ29418.1 ABC transporter substrate-binding protein [Mucilaginibacter mali]
MITLTDQLGRPVSLEQPPSRIISLVPSQTELLYYLGLDDRIVGITKFCTHPADKVKSKTKIGGTKQLDTPLIRSLDPDLIIANKEENERLQLQNLMADYPVYVSDPNDMDTALAMISDIGRLTSCQQAADELSSTISQQFAKLEEERLTGLSVAYLIWRKPYMVASKGTYIDDMLDRCGFVNVFKQQRYPEVSNEMLAATRPDVVLLSSEPYPFKQKHIDEFAQLLPGAIIKLVDGEMFSWYGSRMLYAPEYFIKLINSIQTI